MRWRCKIMVLMQIFSCGGKQQRKMLRVKTSIAVFMGAIIVGLEETHYGYFAGIVAHWIYGDGIRDFLFGQKMAMAEQEYEVVDVICE